MPPLPPRSPIHARDFGRLREQRTLDSLPADAAGQVRFRCLRCPRTGQVPLDLLRARFRPTEGLVDILNTLLPPDCPRAERDASGIVACGWCYRDLGEAPPLSGL